MANQWPESLQHHPARAARHRIWMIRNYALTLVAASARVLSPFSILFFVLFHGGSFGNNPYDYVFTKVLESGLWCGIVCNLVIVEWMVIRKRQKT
ncbi:hypothetical protein [Laceyella putida]|uniref:Uncharacterized protein n=1 Tax=Laceyella putida TaxID=110101 RepID=A0ABW2RLV2_9BACL